MPELTGFAGEYAARPVRKAFLALSPEQRTAATQVLGAAVKALVLSSPFRAAWEAEVKSRGGVNHGVSAEAPAPQAPAQAMDAAKKAILESRVKDAQQFAKNKPMPASTLQIIIDVDLSIVAPPDSMMVASPAAQKAAVAKYQEAKKLLASDAVAAQKAVLDAKLLAAGLAAGSAGVDQAAARTGAQSAADDQRRQQATWNKLQLAPLVRDVLQGLIQTAATVDFAAATVVKDKKVVFVNPAYERKSYDWKLLYRAGQGPTGAAVALAKQVLAEMR
ncbi:MAG: hypothetical protein IT162_10815 [Bryobacterales bacterium]|nr:hypothetical protein [Bryobacterales bacterium]